ncbi:hypothetical protein BGZ99_004190 [Dissophora globulifera]|uniref:Uncharacterized protein n=1 Tax=Dissophora globulifera TaxID=979702 RepID=A0A9P6RTW8_9FUNG|nr:hypothetical protein BGZ99_004190 [Dissophora globulifera]
MTISKAAEPAVVTDVFTGLTFTRTLHNGDINTINLASTVTKTETLTQTITVRQGSSSSDHTEVPLVPHVAKTITVVSYTSTVATTTSAATAAAAVITPTENKSVKLDAKARAGANSSPVVSATLRTKDSSKFTITDVVDGHTRTRTVSDGQTEFFTATVAAPEPLNNKRRTKTVMNHQQPIATTAVGSIENERVGRIRETASTITEAINGKIFTRTVQGGQVDTLTVPVHVTAVIGGQTVTTTINDGDSLSFPPRTVTKAVNSAETPECIITDVINEQATIRTVRMDNIYKFSVPVVVTEVRSHETKLATLNYGDTISLETQCVTAGLPGSTLLVPQPELAGVVAPAPAAATASSSVPAGAKPKALIARASTGLSSDDSKTTPTTTVGTITSGSRANERSNVITDTINGETLTPTVTKGDGTMIHAAPGTTRAAASCVITDTINGRPTTRTVSDGENATQRVDCVVTDTVNGVTKTRTISDGENASIAAPCRVTEILNGQTLTLGPHLAKVGHQTLLSAAKDVLATRIVTDGQLTTLPLPPSSCPTCLACPTPAAAVPVGVIPEKINNAAKTPTVSKGADASVPEACHFTDVINGKTIARTITDPSVTNTLSAPCVVTEVANGYTFTRWLDGGHDLQTMMVPCLITEAINGWTTSFMIGDRETVSFAADCQVTDTVQGTTFTRTVSHGDGTAFEVATAKPCPTSLVITDTINGERLVRTVQKGRQHPITRGCTRTIQQ